ncbi:MAG: SusC/RagA family TonB-linked outer membrane protein [Gemmatimonadaceae bacterium]|nr:SusC/RagA family TonB-linked outer membrane protein [Gemmatimonadaceae bacterium]
MAFVRYLLPAFVGNLLWAIALGAQAPAVNVGTASITGRVIDSVTQRPVSDVAIVIEGTRRGTVTREDGSFVLGGLAAGSYTIRARRIGYGAPTQTVTLPAGGTATLRFSLDRVAAILEEVVTTGYGTQRRLAITGSIATIDADAANVGVVTNVDQMIQGRAPGVHMTQNSGEPGGGAQIRIRGGTSISASNDPLYVIDGVPINNIATQPSGLGVGGEPPLPRNPMNMLNPSDIASISVLKDAAAAIYGTRGSNGVIVIETKKGTGGGPSMEYDVSAGTSSMNRYLGLMGGDQFRQYVQEQVAAGKVGTGVLALLGQTSTDWERAISRTATTVNHNLAFSGGTAGTQYRASLNHMNQQGVVIDNGFKRYQARLNAAHQALDGRLRLGLNLTGSHVKDDYLPFENTGGFEGGVFINTVIFNPTVPVTTTDATTGESTFFEVPGQTSVRNPVALASEIVDLGTTTRSLGNISADLDLFGGLTGRVNVGLDRFDSNRGTYFPRSNPVGAEFQGRARQANRNNTSKTIQTILTFHPEYSTRQDFELLGGYEFLENTLNEFSAESRGFLTDASGFNSLSSGSLVQPLFSRREDSRTVGFFSRANYSFADRYFLTGVLRRDGSSRFGVGNKWAVFPAISGSWRISEESFMPRGLFSELRLRAGWGKQGNPAVPPYASLILLAADGGSRYVFGDRAVTGFSPTQNPNPNLKWEETAQTNVALDYGFLNNRFSGSVEYYVKNTSDLLLTVPVAQPAVVSTRLENIGKTRNKGLEMSLDALLLSRPSMTWSSGLVLDVQRNEVVDLGGRSFLSTGRVSGEGQSGQVSQRIIPGEAIGTFYGPEFIGVTSSGQQEFNKYKVTRDASGRELTRVLDGKTTSPGGDDYVIIGDANPAFSLGLRSQATFGRFDASLLVNTQQGNDVFNNTALVYATKGNAKRGKNFIATALGDGVGIDEPQIYSSRWIEDGSFVRLQNITVGYTFDLPRFTGAGRSSRVYLSGDNLLLMTDYSGYDPEVHTDASTNSIATRGIDYLHYPRPRTITGGLRVSF